MKSEVEFGSYMNPSRKMLPEEGLLTALILRAFYDLFEGHDLAQDARAWFLGLIPDSPMPYERACELLGIEASGLWTAIQNRVDGSPDMVEFSHVAGDKRRPPRCGRSPLGYFAARLNA